MGKPSVNISLLNGQLGIVGPSVLGTSCLIVAAPAAPTAGLGVAFKVTNKQEVSAAFSNVANAAVVTAINSAFYGEAPEGTELHIVAMAQTTTLDVLAAATNVEKALNNANGKARFVGIVKFPAGAYTPTVTNGFDADVHTAVPILQAVANTWVANKKGFRFIVQGYASTGVASAATDYAVTDNRNGCIVNAELDNSSANATLAYMGRLARIAPQENAGKIKLGSLKVPSTWTLKIGGTLINSVTEATLSSYHDKRYVVFEQNAIASGYVPTNDVMTCKPTDDYYNMRHGRIIDNGVRVAFETYYKELKDDVKVDADTGLISTAAQKALETAIETAIDAQMRTQLSTDKTGRAAVSVAVNPDYTANIALYNQNGITTPPNFNLLQTGNTYIFVKMKPKGCLEFINVFIGF